MLVGHRAGSKNELCRWAIAGCTRSTRVTHAAWIVLGTVCYYFPDWAEGALAAGVLYTLGSCGFLCVDVLEFFTFDEDPWLRVNISMSATGCVLVFQVSRSALALCVRG